MFMFKMYFVPKCIDSLECVEDMDNPYSCHKVIDYDPEEGDWFSNETHAIEQAVDQKSLVISVEADKESTSKVVYDFQWEKACAESDAEDANEKRYLCSH